MKTRRLIALFLFLSFTGFAQKKEAVEITIKVKSDKNKPVAGALILIDNIKQKRRANRKGVFKIKLQKTPKEIAVFSPLLGIKKIKYQGQKNIFITLGKDNGMNAVNNRNINNKKVGATQFINIYDYLRGKVPGVNIGTNNTIRIRGYSTFSGGRGPLFILNGMQVDATTFENIVPTNIRKVTILKGPETAIYGVRGANGVIEVTTMFY